jgi:hypothetical protein
MRLLCIGSAADETYVHSIAAFKRAHVAFHAFDLVQLAESGHVRIELGNPSAAVFDLGSMSAVLSQFDGAWIRLLNFGAGAPSYPLKCRADGLVNTLARLFESSPIPVINPPLRDCANGSKLFHGVALARLVGFRIPRSCLTNSPDTAQAFLDTCSEGAIFKGASSTKTWAAHYEPAVHRSRLPLVARCPTLFQERIVGPDVRVHVVGSHTFAEMIESPSIDYRRVRGNVYHPTTLPTGISAGCTSLSNMFSVPFLGIDFKVQRSSGDWFFLEANTMPCYQGYDRRTGGAIATALIDWFRTSSSN